MEGSISNSMDGGMERLRRLDGTVAENAEGTGSRGERRTLSPSVLGALRVSA